MILGSWEENEILGAIPHLSLDPFLPSPSSFLPATVVYFEFFTSWPLHTSRPLTLLWLSLAAWTVLSPMPHLACSYSSQSLLRGTLPLQFFMISAVRAPVSQVRKLTLDEKSPHDMGWILRWLGFQPPFLTTSVGFFLKFHPLQRFPAPCRTLVC